MEDDMLESLFTNEECEISLWTAPLLMTISRMEARYEQKSFAFGDVCIQLKSLAASSSKSLCTSADSRSLQCKLQKLSFIKALSFPNSGGLSRGFSTFSTSCMLAECLQQADYDLTGQIIWPAATLLADYLGERPNIMTGRRAACELGSGVGLTGLVCGQFCNTVLTDHNKIVLKVLQENVGRNPSQHKVRCQPADWESLEDILAVKALSPNEEGFDLVLGADICYSLKALPSIFRALACLLAREPVSMGLLGYVSRAAAIDRGIFEEAEKAGLSLIKVHGTSKEIGGGLQGAIFSFQHTA